MPWLVCVLCAAASAAWSAERVEPPGVAWPTAGWQESTPEQQGMASLAVRRLVDFGAKNGMDSLLVIRHGTVVADTYYAPYRPGLKHHLYSATKGVLGTLTGIAVQDGLLKGVAQPVVDFFPDLVIAPDDPRKKTITIDHLLDMTSGLDWKEPLDGAPETLRAMRRSPHWSAFVLERPMVQPPGTAFNYSSGNSQLLSAVLTRATGKSAADFARERLFGPLGITDTLWRLDPQGDSIGGFGLYLHPRDMAKIGYLYLHHGQWDGQQLLPPRWTDKVFHATVDMRMGNPSAFRYANGWWSIPRQNVYMAVGFLQQIIMVLPKLDMVVVVTGKKPPRFEPLVDLLEASATSTLALPPNPTAHADLVRRVEEAATEKTTSVAVPSDMATTVGGRLYRFERNALGLDTLVLDLGDTDPRYEMRFSTNGPLDATLRFAGPIGLDGRFRTNGEASGPQLAVKASWADASTLSLVSQWLTDGVVATYTLRFAGNTVDVGYKDNSGITTQLHGVSTP
jgi:CubicO group peptidase (beta-lactamase class C family)